MTRAEMNEGSPTATEISESVPNEGLPKAGFAFQASLIAAMFGLNFVTIVPAIVTLAVRMNTVAHGNQQAATNALSIVLFIGTLITIVANPLMATFSDRTTLRLGRRRPWFIGGAIVGFGGTILSGIGTDVLTIVVGWSLVQLGFGACLVTAQALVPERLAPSQRGKFSGIVGMFAAVSIFAGVQATNIFLDYQAALMIVPGVIAIVLITVLVVQLRDDRPATRNELAPFRFRRFIGSFWINPLRHRDFGLVWISRFLVGLTTAGFQAYTLYFLMSNLGGPIGEATAANAVAQTVTLPISIALFLVSGWLSDRLGRRKPFVLIGGVSVAVAVALAIFTHDVAMFVVVSIILTVGNSLFLTVDLALAADVIPDKQEPGRGMAVYGLSTSLPNSAISIIAPVILAVGSATSSNYSLLFAILAPVALIGAVLTLFIRNVK